MYRTTEWGHAVAIAAVATLAVVAATACGRSSTESGARGGSPSGNSQAAPASTTTSPPPGPASAPATLAQPGPTAAPAATNTSSLGPAGLTQSPAPADLPQASAIGPMAVATKAIELRVEGVETAAQIGGRQARPGYEFVIVDTSWKNIIPLTAVDPKKAADGSYGAGGVGFGSPGGAGSTQAAPGDIRMEPTKYIVPALNRHVWLLTDERFADTFDVAAQTATPGHMPTDVFAIAKFEETLRGKFVFEAPAGAQYRALQFYDTKYGHALVTLKGTRPATPPVALGAPRQNDVLQLAVTEAAFGPTDRPAPPGLRYYTVGLRGVSRSPTDIVDVQFNKYVFLQTDQACVAQPEHNPPGLARPFADIGSFLPTSPNEGQLTFLVPEDTKNVRLLVLPVSLGAIDLPLNSDVAPAWPTPAHTIQDGSTMRVHVLPPPARPATLPAPAGGREQVLLDVVVENLKPTQGIEFQGMQQLRLVDPSGTFTAPSALSAQVPCRLDRTGVIPAGHARRFTLVYDVLAGQAWRLQYRGFEKTEEFIDLK